MAGFTVTIPPVIVTSARAKPWPLNLNRYLTTHNQRLGALKKAVSRDTRLRLLDKPKLRREVRITYTLYRATAHRIDVSIVRSIADKFFSDCLTEAGLIEDDNASVIPEVRYVYGGIDPADPRIEIAVEEMAGLVALAPTPAEPPPNQETIPVKIQISFDQGDLEDLVRRKVADQFPALAGAELDIRLEGGELVVNVGKAPAAKGHLVNPDEAKYRQGTDFTPVQAIQEALNDAPEAHTVTEVEELPNWPRKETYFQDEAMRREKPKPVNEFVPEGDDRPLPLADTAKELMDKAIQISHVEVPAAEWVDANGNPVDDRRFIGKTWKQIAGIKGADNRAKAREAGEKAQAQITFRAAYGKQEEDAAEELRRKALEGFRKAYPSTPEPAGSIYPVPEQDFTKQALEPDYTVAYFTQEDGTIRIATPEEWGAMSEQEQDAYTEARNAQEPQPTGESVADVGDTLDAGAELDAKLAEPAAPKEAPGMPPFMRKLLADAEAKKAAAEQAAAAPAKPAMFPAKAQPAVTGDKPNPKTLFQLSRAARG